MKKITLLDGAVGTSIWEKTTDKEPVWVYNIRRPDVVKELALEYIEAGAEIILCNTFGANRLSVQRSSNYSVSEVVAAAVKIAAEAVNGTNVKIALSAGPLSQLMEPYGDLSEDTVAEIYREMFEAGLSLDKKPDIIMLQTFIDLEMLRVAAVEAKKCGLPVFCTMSFEAMGKTIFGNSVDDVIEVLTEVGVDAVGLNCSLGPESALPIIKQFKEKTNLPIVFKPNSGKPILSSDGTGESPYTPDLFAEELKEAFPYVDYIGGCCGTNAKFISRLRAELDQMQ